MTSSGPKPLHVLHVISTLGAGGTELTMARVIRGLRSPMRHSIACLRGPCHIGEYLPGETDIHCLDARPNEPQLPLRLARLMRAVRPSVVHARNWGAWPDTAVGRLLARPAPPLVFSFHGQGDSPSVPLRRRLASRVLVRMTTHLFTLSEQSRRMLAAVWGWPAGRVEVIPNGVDTERFSPGDAPRSSGRLAVGMVGNLRAVKNHALAIRACAQLAGRGVDLELRLAGTGPLRDNLAALAASLGFGDRLKPAGSVADVPDFLRRLDVFLLTSDSEQHPNSLTEALACGVASIATRVGCVEELLDGGRCGRIVPPGDVEALTAALAEVLAGPSLRRQYTSAGREHVVAHYSLDRMLRAYEAMYRRLAGGGD